MVTGYDSTPQQLWFPPSALLDHPCTYSFLSFHLSRPHTPTLTKDSPLQENALCSVLYTSVFLCMPLPLFLPSFSFSLSSDNQLGRGKKEEIRLVTILDIIEVWEWTSLVMPSIRVNQGQLFRPTRLTQPCVGIKFFIGYVPKLCIIFWSIKYFPLNKEVYFYCFVCLQLTR